MKTIPFILLPLLVLACLPEKQENPLEPADQTRLIARGEYLVQIMDCETCHTPKVFGEHGPQPDPKRRLSGHPSDLAIAEYPTSILPDWVLFNHHTTAAAGPWGVSFSANLTSDDTGIGLWTEEQFFRAIREGKYKGMQNGRPLLPPMPWSSFSKLTDEDLRSIFAYLQSTDPVHNIVPPPIPPALAAKEN